MRTSQGRARVTTAAGMFAAVLLLTGCDQTVERAVVTETVTVQEPAAEPRQAEPALCDTIRTMRDTNERLARDGYADDYSAQYDQQLRTNGCD